MGAAHVGSVPREPGCGVADSAVWSALYERLSCAIRYGATR